MLPPRATLPPITPHSFTAIQIPQNIPLFLTPGGVCSQDQYIGTVRSQNPFLTAGAPTLSAPLIPTLRMRPPGSEAPPPSNSGTPPAPPPDGGAGDGDGGKKAPGARPLRAPPRTGNSKMASARQGILKHGEHLADLVLDIVPGTEDESFPAFEQYRSFISTCIEWIKAQEIAVLNEKFDGSPSLVLGFDADERPFVAYKHGVERAGDPRIVRTVREARQLFSGSPMGEILEDCIRYLRRRIARFPERNLVFQADLLFTPRNGAKEVTKDAVTIRANPFGIEYALPHGSTFAPFASEAQLGLIVHTVGRRVLDEKTGAIIGVKPLESPELVEGFVKALRSKDVFVIDPWSRQVRIDQGAEHSFSAEKEQSLDQMLHALQENLSLLGHDFRTAWKPFLPHFRIFQNSTLKAGRSGGLYRASALDEPFDFTRLYKAFHAWILKRSETLRISPKGAKSRLAPKKMPAAFEALLERFPLELQAYLQAYYDANRMLSLLKPHMAEVYRSKLGGGRIEGIMLTDETTQVKVKLVDRLDFTMQNFSGEGKRRTQRRKSPAKTKRPTAKRRPVLPQSLRRWHAGAAFFLCKLQPPHAGHIAHIGAAIEGFGTEQVFIIASNKAPDVTAGHWRDLGVADRKRDLIDGAYRHVFSPELRQEILQYGLPEGVTLLFADPSLFWSYVKRAQEKGRRGAVHLLMGAKEMLAGRYEQQLERFGDHVHAEVIPMQQEGLSATAVRNAIRSLHARGDIGSYEQLVDALSFIPKKKRDRIIGQLLKEWGEVDRAVTRLV